MIPFSCAASNASAIWRAIGSASATGRASAAFALHQLHDERIAFKPIDRGDVGMIERGQHLRLALEAGPVIGVIGQCRRQHLDGDVAVKLGVARAIHLAHAALADERKDLIRAESFAGGRLHSSE